MSHSSSQNSYVMFDQARDTVRKIMHERRAEPLISHPSWLALGLLLIAFHIVAITAP